MARSSGRLDVPGFSFGQKTGEYIDVPRIYGGHGAKRKSGIPHSTPELLGGRVLTQGRKELVLATAIAKQEYNKGKRFRAKQQKQAITNPPAAYCTRRYLELIGVKRPSFQFSDPPELIIPKAKTVYELTDGLMPFLSVTSAREAELLCRTLAHYGVAAYFNQRQIFRP